MRSSARHQDVAFPLCMASGRGMSFSARYPDTACAFAHGIKTRREAFAHGVRFPARRAFLIRRAFLTRRVACSVNENFWVYETKQKLPEEF